MWFDAQAELAKLGGDRENGTCPPATFATSATPRARVAIVADVAAPVATLATFATYGAGVAEVAVVATPSAPEINPRNKTVGGRVKTWTGRVVSLDEWHSLTALQRHGPNGRLWCGITRSWKQPEET